MPINWNNIRTKWKQAMKDPKTANNVDEVVDEMVDVLQTEMGNAQVSGSTSDGATIVAPTTQIT
mgnify:CR=1 FL=1|tara:strand:- start:478 stop:669 length:192 start_codon:yes stop_codon:yes gene_type:complete